MLRLWPYNGHWLWFEEEPMVIIAPAYCCCMSYIIYVGDIRRDFDLVMSRRLRRGVSDEWESKGNHW